MVDRDDKAAARNNDYITPGGHKKLADELDYLWRVERRKVTKQVGEAAELGDRSENAEYIYGKRRLREIDRRLRWLSKRLDALTVVHPNPSQRGRVFFGAHVVVEDEEGEELSLQIVGPDEVDATIRKISIDSPMGRALLGKRVDDEVIVRRPKGRGRFTVVEISYEGINENEE